MNDLIRKIYLRLFSKNYGATLHYYMLCKRKVFETIPNYDSTFNMKVGCSNENLFMFDNYGSILKCYYQPLKNFKHIHDINFTYILCDNFYKLNKIIYENVKHINYCIELDLPNSNNRLFLLYDVSRENIKKLITVAKDDGINESNYSKYFYVGEGLESTEYLVGVRLNDFINNIYFKD